MELFDEDRYEPPMAFGSRDCKGARLVGGPAPDNLADRCALLIGFPFLGTALLVAGAGMRSSHWFSRGVMVFCLYTRIQRSFVCLRLLYRNELEFVDSVDLYFQWLVISMIIELVGG